MGSNRANFSFVNIKKISSNRFVDNVLELESLSTEDGDLDFENSIASFLKNYAKEGQIIEGTIVAIDRDKVTIDAGLKSEGIISTKEFLVGDEYEDIKVGDKTRVFLDKLEGRTGNVILSREKAIKDDLWNRLEDAAKNKVKVEGVIFSPIKCGYAVDIGGVVAFLPASHVDLRQVKDIAPLLGKKQKFYILKMDKQQGNIVVSRKTVLEESLSAAKNDFISKLNEGDIVEGKVKSITNYGVFVGIHESEEIGVVDGLVYITDLSWSRVHHPSAMFVCGQTVKTKIINIDRENNKISLGVKQLEGNPWTDYDIEKKYAINSVHKGHITTIENYGFFVELKPGIEGLVHLSEIQWTKSNLPINQLFIKGQEMEVKVLNIDLTKNRMGLSVKRCKDNPWEKFMQKYQLGSVVDATIKNISSFGLFVSFDDLELEPNIDGLVRSTELSWSLQAEEALKGYNVGDKVKAKVLMVNVNKGKIDLGIKHIERDPFLELLKKISIGDKLTVTVSKVEDAGVIVDVFGGSNSFYVFSERQYLPENKKFYPGDKVEAEVLVLENYNLILSLK